MQANPIGDGLHAADHRKTLRSTHLLPLRHQPTFDPALPCAEAADQPGTAPPQHEPPKSGSLISPDCRFRGIETRRIVEPPCSAARIPRHEEKWRCQREQSFTG